MHALRGNTPPFFPLWYPSGVPEESQVTNRKLIAINTCYTSCHYDNRDDGDDDRDDKQNDKVERRRVPSILDLLQ